MGKRKSFPFWRVFLLNAPPEAEHEIVIDFKQWVLSLGNFFVKPNKPFRSHDRINWILCDEKSTIRTNTSPRRKTRACNYEQYVGEYLTTAYDRFGNVVWVYADHFYEHYKWEFFEDEEDEEDSEATPKFHHPGDYANYLKRCIKETRIEQYLLRLQLGKILFDAWSVYE